MVIPGAYYTDNVSNALQPTIPTTPPLVYVGYGYGQKPQVPTTYFDGNSLLTAIRGGPASAYVPFLVNPSPQLNGAQQITFINVGENTQSTLTLSNASGSLLLTSANYGLPSNLLAAAVTAGTVSGGNARTVTLYDNFASTQITGTNASLPLQILYTGNASAVTFTVSGSGTANVSTFFATSGSTSGTENIKVQFSNYPTVSQLVQYLNGTGVYTCQVYGNNGLMPCANIDVHGAIALASGTSAYTNISANLTGPNWWINTYGSGYCTSTVSGASVRGIPLVVSGTQAFSGAVSVPPVNADYGSGFNVALTIPGWAVFADSNASAVQLLGGQHVTTASSPAGGNRNRRFFTGSNIGDTIGATASAAGNLDSIRTTYCYPGIWRVDPTTGINTQYGGLYVAAAAAAMSTGNSPQTPLTNKALNGNAVEVTLTTANIDTLQQNGVLPIWISPQTGQPTIVSDFTTWQLDANPENVFNQQVACRDFLCYSVVNALTPYVGTVADPLSLNRILQAVQTVLNALLYSSGSSAGILVSWDPSSLKLIYTGAQQLAAVMVNVVFVGQNRFITATVNVLPLSITITNATLAAGASGIGGVGGSSGGGGGNPSGRFPFG